MKINEYYRDTATVNLNGSIAALFPAILIFVINFLFLHNKQIILLTIPFLIYSLISFQIYRIRLNQSFSIKDNVNDSINSKQTILNTKHLLVVFLNTQFSSILFYFPDGHLAGKIKKYRDKKRSIWNQTKTFALYNQKNQIQGFYHIKGKRIEAFNESHSYLGCFENTKKGKKELLNEMGKFIGAVEGASLYMDERIVDNGEIEVGRLRRGWMPFEWSTRFPEPNTPVLTLSEQLTENEKLLKMSFLIHEYFIKR